MRRLFPAAALLLAVAAVAPAAEPAEGVLPTGADGKPLNLDFETGDLRDWTATGDAFTGQPVKGDTVTPRRADMKSRHQGQYWIGGWERHGDKAQGTLTSVPFTVTHPWCSFLVGGGPYDVTCVELVRKDTGAVVARTSGLAEEDLRRVAVDLQPHQGKEIFIRLVDRHTGHWGHVNFDDFRLHSKKPDPPPRPAPREQLNTPASPADVYKYAGLPPEKAAAVMTVPEGFTVKLFAGEPDVKQPIAFCLDDRGRLWVAEAYSYPARQPEGQGKDRILIFEDTDGDGHFDKRTVFMEGLNLVSGLEVGFGGVWVGAAPYLMFIPVDASGDKPAGPPQILLDGWAYEDTHETLNTFTWGPDGWLYGCHGVFTHSRVGKPSTPNDQRVPINAGIWRYHPTRHEFEVFAHGTSNPWGLDFNDHGQMFIEACVIPHNWHIIQGGRYQRQAGSHFNPYTYDDVKTIAEHRHWVGANPHAGNNRSDSAGGGHAHAGTMIYLGGAWPAEYRNQMFMGNVHGRRLNVDRLTPKGSGYVASRSPDFLLANDAWARFINLRYGPDGNAYLIDWYDEQACHNNNPQIWDRTNGRIYKICYQGVKPVTGIDLQKASNEELVKYQLSDNEWYVRHARRILQERFGLTFAGRSLKPGSGSVVAEADGIRNSLRRIASDDPVESRRLRGLWALYNSFGLLMGDDVAKGLTDAGPYVRAWTIQLALEQGLATETLLKQMGGLAKSDPSPVVRLYIASALQRLSLEQRWPIVENLVAHAEDATDHNLPLMYWYAAEPLAGVDPARALDLAARSKIPILLPFMARRIGSSGKPEALALLVDRLAHADNAAAQEAILNGIRLGLQGRRRVAMPSGWPAAFAKLSASGNAELRQHATALAVTFGDPQAVDALRHLLTDNSAGVTARQNALAALLAADTPQLAPTLHKLVADPALRAAAIKGLAAYADPATPEVLLAAYPSLPVAEKKDVLNTLAARPAYGKALVEAVAAKTVPAAEVTAEVVRQLTNLKDAGIDKRIGEVWGIIRPTPADRAKLIAQYRRMLTAPYSPKGDLNLGRAVYTKTCAQCHTLYGTGGKVGPELTGSNRANLDYLLENILDPSAVIPKDYAVTLLALTSGRVVTGIVREETPAALTVVTANETLTIPKGEVESRQPSDVSMMPEDQLKPMPEAEVRALFAYLQNPTQVPVLATADNAKDLFNGKDLTGWDGDPKLWSVENGEIVGKSPGIKHNEFLKSQMVAGDFKLTLKLKLVPNAGNSGVQFRSEALPNGEMKGPQADVGAGWWGKLYEESGRGVLSNKSGEPFVKKEDWNEYVVEASGSRIRTWINGQLCVDLDDPAVSRRGVFGLQIHSGGPMEVRFKDLKLEVPAAK
jgi:putative membrane-bound dehydrogenase-like protein